MRCSKAGKKKRRKEIPRRGIRGTRGLKRSHSRSSRELIERPRAAARAAGRIDGAGGLCAGGGGAGAGANFAPRFEIPRARMKMIWDQRNSTPVIQHFSPKLLGLSYPARAMRSGGAREWALRARARANVRPIGSNGGGGAGFPREIGAPVLFTLVQERNMFENKVPPMSGKLDFCRAFRPTKFYFRAIPCFFPLLLLPPILSFFHSLGRKMVDARGSLSVGTRRLLREAARRLAFLCTEPFNPPKETFRIITLLREDKVLPS